jgi:type VI secretion system secreted protein VgrG
VYTGADAPPFAAGVDSGVDHAGTISGIQTRGFDGAGYNQWQLDDAKASYACASLPAAPTPS